MEHKNKKPTSVAKTQLNNDILITPQIPPTMLVHAEDDPVTPPYYPMLYAKELKKAGVSVKLNIYKTGGHAFGVRKQGADTDKWTQDALAWLNEIDVL